MATWTYNNNMMICGYTPIQLMLGKSVTYSRVSEGNTASESTFEDEVVRRIMESHFAVGKKFRELEFGAKIEKAATLTNFSMPTAVDLRHKFARSDMFSVVQIHDEVVAHG